MRRFKSTLVHRNHFKHSDDNDSATSSDADSESTTDAGPPPPFPHHVDSMSLFDVWLESRPRQRSPAEHTECPLPPGSRRAFTPRNIALASRMVCVTFYDMIRLLSGLSPIRTVVMIFLTIIRGLLPAFRGYSQALILDEVNTI